MTNFFIYGQALFISTRTGARFLALLLDSAKSPVDYCAQLHISVQCTVSDTLSPLVRKIKGKRPSNELYLHVALNYLLIMP
jgi:hypothetical protein